MSDSIKHECGIALLRLLKPVDYYYKKYGTYCYALNKMQLLMEKQHNRGQDGAGLACVKFDLDPGKKYIDLIRSNDAMPIKDIFNRIFYSLSNLNVNLNHGSVNSDWLKNNSEFIGDVYLGHLRYGTYGNNNIENLHPVLRVNNWKTRNLALAGNFNLTNMEELFSILVDLGQYPVCTSDTVTILEKIGHFLDDENERLYRIVKAQGYSKAQATDYIIDHLDLLSILRNATKRWDGGYVIGGLLGHGDSFILRDPHGIRPAFYYMDDEIIVAASERPVLQTTFNLHAYQIQELKPAQVLIIKKNGKVIIDNFTEPLNATPCSFERIYFSRGTDRDIYQERKNLGRHLCNPLLKAVNYDIKDTIFSYIPNTAIDAYYGLMDALNSYCDNLKYNEILGMKDIHDNEALSVILNMHPRFEKLAVKDIKLRTFITEDSERDDLVAHVYDTTFGVVKKGLDNIVIIDDSIVRGTTLRQSIIKILDRLCPKMIVIGSSAPQIRYPDCYGIDMAKLKDFVAFNAAIALIKERGMSKLIDDIYNKIKGVINTKEILNTNYVKEIYAPFTVNEISEKISEIVTPINCQAKIKVIYQTIESLHASCPNNGGDWYFTGNYPTPGGNKVSNVSFMNYYEGKDERGY